MKVTVFGANAKVGRLVVGMLLARGHEVVAFVHRTHTFTASRQLTIYQGDIYNAADVDRAVAGSNAIIGALGSWGSPKKDVQTTAAAHIIASMNAHDIRRVISLTGAEARTSGDQLNLVHRAMHAFLSIIAQKVLVDGEQHINLLADSSLGWTVVRSPIMLHGKSDEHSYQLNNVRPMPWSVIDRRAVATAMVDLLDNPSWSDKAPFIHR